MKILEWLKGKKTYIIAGLVGITAVLQHLGYPIPEIVWPILGALGLGAVRAGIKKDVP